ncbi:hypothetical protein [Streptomyces sp. NPDC048496]|uniref:hypothetical protein n=1 Tax=Streptomyces sp. NPDC048496 TaxID=3365558 RepID=UPI003713383C
MPRRRPAAPNADRWRHFPVTLTAADVAGLPHLTALALRRLEITDDYDVTEQLDAVIVGLVRKSAGWPTRTAGQ